MKTTLDQLREIDPELIIEGNCVMLHDKGEFINYHYTYSDQAVDDAWEFYCENMNEFDNDNGGISYSENFPNIVEGDKEEWVEITKQSNNTDKNLVVVYNTAFTNIPLVVQFPTDTIEENVEYEVEYWVEETDKVFEDYEYSDNSWFVS